MLLDIGFVKLRSSPAVRMRFTVVTSFDGQLDASAQGTCCSKVLHYIFVMSTSLSSMSYLRKFIVGLRIPDPEARHAFLAPTSVVREAASVTASLHYNATVAPSDTIFVLAGKLAGLSAPDLLNEESSVQINSPENPPVPILVPEVWYTALAHCKVSVTLLAIRCCTKFHNFSLLTLSFDKIRLKHVQCSKTFAVFVSVNMKIGWCTTVVLYVPNRHETFSRRVVRFANPRTSL